MDPITIILTALVAGTAKAMGDAVPDAYKGLRALIQKKLAGKPEAEMALAKYEEKPDVWKEPLREALAESGVDKDEEILKAAQMLLDKIKEQPGGQEIINQTQTNTVSGVNVGGNFEFKPVQEGKKS